MVYKTKNVYKKSVQKTFLEKKALIILTIITAVWTGENMIIMLYYIDRHKSKLDISANVSDLIRLRLSIFQFFCFCFLIYTLTSERFYQFLLPQTKIT